MGDKPLGVTLSKPVNIRVKVTGVSGGSAEFTWEYTNVPSIVKRYTVKGGSGKAYFTLYDDGWRLQNLSLEQSNEPMMLTAKERTDDEQETRKAMEKAEEVARLQREQGEKEKARIDKLILESKIETTEVGKYTFSHSSEKCNNYGFQETTTSMRISDIGVEINQEISTTDRVRFAPGAPPVVTHASGKVWFGDFEPPQTFFPGDVPFILKAEDSRYLKSCKHQESYTIEFRTREPFGAFLLSGWPLIKSNEEDEINKAYEALVASFTKWGEKNPEVLNGHYR